MPGIRELRKILVRGARVRVRDTPKKTALHEARVFVKSEGLVPCRGDGRCAVDRKCNGHAVFVCKEDPATLPGGAGWRKGASKFCLTHLNADDGEALTKVLKSKVKAPKKELAPVDLETFREVEEIGEPVTWIELAHAALGAQRGDSDSLTKLILFARRLKASGARLQHQVIEAQRGLIEVQRTALDQISSERQEVEESYSAFGDHGIFDPEDQDSYTSDTRDHPLI